jgi:signal transduction histidine kinase
VSNAVKYTPEGGCVRVSVKEAGGMGAVTVEDDGIGIPDGELPMVFERFYRADKSRNRGTGGAGIGLAVVKSVVAAHGGEVEAWSALGEGSRFEVRLPKQAPPK